MMPETTANTALPRRPCRPFPWHCIRCRKQEVVLAEIPYGGQRVHDGQTYAVEVPHLNVPRCANCGELAFTDDTEDQIREALRGQLKLLSPDQIRQGRTALDLNQNELAVRLGTSEQIVARWEAGDELPSRALDNLLRVYFAFPEVRSVLRGSHQDPYLGRTVVGA